MPLLSAPSLGSKFTQLVIAAGVLTIVAWLFVTSFGVPQQLHIPGLDVKLPVSDKPPPTHATKPGDHPIEELIERADVELARLLKKEAHTLDDAAKQYRERRGRQPPPGFDLWFAFARNHSAVLVEEFFDRVYDDLNPFWGVPAKQMREQAKTFEHAISVRNGSVTQRSDHADRPWMGLWQDMVASIVKDGGWVPDVDMPINVMDESRMVVESEEIDAHMAREKEGRKIVPAEKLKPSFHGLEEVDNNPPEGFDPQFRGEGPYWPLAVVGCPPGSPARKTYIETDFSSPPPLTPGYPEHSFHGYVQNWTLAKDACDNPNFQGLHGTFVEPISIGNTKKFFPLFGGSKLSMNNEILLPPAMYWTTDEFYSGGEDHGVDWSEKQDILVWRGSATGGRNRKENWTRFQRHRFISMVNATSVREAEHGRKPPNFILPEKGDYNLESHMSASHNGSLADWIDTWSDAATVYLQCFPDSGAHCWYTDHYFEVKKGMKMSEQYRYKYLPDIDGNSFSGRYRGFLGSTSLPIKATIYDEWHDSRLVPWKHFVPMDNTFADIYGIMEFFIGNEKVGLAGHDAVAEKIAMEGKAWTERVLRKEDMQIYVFRLLLEYARLCDDSRDVLGWAAGTGTGSGMI
jgi:hypothetical protein